MWPTLIPIIGDIIGKLIPDPAAKAEMQLKLYQLQQAGELEQVKVQLSAIIAEANSADPWTSRARPSFLYVVYVLLLWSIPMGILSMFRPDLAASFTAGFSAWMGSIPSDVLTLFGVVMTGYIGGRSWEKVRGVTK